MAATAAVVPGRFQRLPMGAAAWAGRLGPLPGAACINDLGCAVLLLQLGNQLGQWTLGQHGGDLGTRCRHVGISAEAETACLPTCHASFHGRGG